MYESFYGLKEKPFRMVPDPGYLYLSPKHQQALTYLEYGLMEEAGFILLSGEVGAGKTTLIRYLLGRMDKEIVTAVVFNTNFSPSEIVDRVLQSLDLRPERTKTESLERLYAFLIEKYAEGKRVLLIIDEAQNLSRESLEEVRMLSNLQSDEKSLLQIMLVGQPELREKLLSPELSSFAQRIAVQYHIQPLERDEMQAYVAHRLKKAGGREDIFERKALDLVFEASGGIPRAVNLLCDAALVYGFGYELQSIGEAVIRQVIEDKGGMGIATGSEDVRKGDLGGTGRPETGKKSLEERLTELEGELKALGGRLEARVGDLEKTAGRYALEMAVKMRELYLEERRRNERLLAHLLKLKKNKGP
jgi:general secretion pathway protein A